MGFSGRIVTAALVLACGLALGLAVFAADEKDITLKGGAIWNGNNKRADVTAVLTPTARKGEYSVVYTFVWEKANYTYTGIIRGNLKNGDVAGTGAPADQRRTFMFQAKAVNGVISGKHYETTGGKTKLTGDIGLK